MPVPWKKAKIGRISRFVSDFRSSRRGGSLVVETGFPTSVIDLIVKNRDRLKKPSKKKPLEVWDPIPLFSSSSNSSNSRFSPSPVVSPLEIESPKQPTGEETHPLVANLVENVSEVPASNGTFMIIIKVFFMLILALGTKKLAFGITVSAFALLFLESAAIRVFCFLKPCADARQSLKSVVERVWFFFHPKTKLIGLDGSAVTEETMGNDIFGLSEVGQASIEEIKPVVPDLDVLSCEKRWGIDVSEDGQARSKDIQLVEPGLDFLSRERRWGTGSSEVDQASCEGIQRVESSLNLLSPERRWGIRSIEGGQARSQEIQLVEPKLDLLCRERWEFGQSDQNLKILEKVEDFVQVTNPRSQRTNSTKLKAKFLKRLIPKKFRSSKGVMHKEHQPASSIETSNCSGEEKLSGGEELERKEDELEEPEDEEVEKNTDEEEEEVQNFVDVLHVDLDAAVVQDNYRRTQGSSGYVLLIVIVLAGLVGGRFIALELTIAWCLLVKSMGVVKRILKMS